jgi:hypothetical protein
MNDQTLFEMVGRADPLLAGVGEPPHELLERVLSTPRATSRRRLRGWPARFVLVAAVLSVSAVIASLAIAGTGWLIGSPAPANVRSDFGSYARQLGFDPRPGKAVLVASNGDYQLYATANEQGGLCTLVSTPWNRPGPNGEGGDCTANTPDASAFWAGTAGMSATANNASTLVIDGHTTDAGAASVRFDAPNGETVTAPVGASGFFIVGTTVRGSVCDWGAWTPRFTVLDGNGKQLGATSVTIFPGARKTTIPGRGHACVALTHGPFGRSAGQLPLSR